MKFFGAMCIVLLFLHAVAGSYEQCGRNERYNRCGTACPLTCENYDKPPEPCNLNCESGCECKKGYVRRADGSCVRPNQCPKKQEPVCGKNERYNECGSACPLTCENYDKPPEPCNLNCESGCECKGGYVRHANGSCVRPNQCPVKDVCGENERYNECGTACPLTCENYDKPPEPCNLSCESGCECVEGFVKDDNGKCVMPDQCPKKDTGECEENQRYYHCEIACPFLTCRNYDKPPEICPYDCVVGCLCAEGYVKSADHKCVRPDQCQNNWEDVCGENERYNDCATLCNLTCENYDKAPESCNTFCQERCECVEGFVRRSDGKCIRPDQCPNTKAQSCGENEHYNECGTACPLTCENYDNPPKICPPNCEIGCECDDGFVKNADGKCIRPDRCPNRQGGHQCKYQGKTYFEGEVIPTQRLCLKCVCSPDFVEPNVHVCDVINCPVHKPGCVPVYNDTECCPVSYNCEKTKNSTKCEKRYFKHYEAKGCTPQFEEGNDCPKKFNCPKELKMNDKACQYHGRLYQIGDKIDTEDPCQDCKCKQNSEGLEITCDLVDCSKDVGPKLNNTCREIYEPGKCCAVRVECEKTCEYGGKIYKLGEKIYPEEDPCISCTCTEDWVGISEDSCTFHDCVLENERKNLAQGCLPIYQEDTCCPKELLCDFPEEGLLYRSAGTPRVQDIASGNFCEFKGNRYKVGDVLDYRHPPNSFTCTCLTPPDFTCVRRKCPGPPNEDYGNCRPIYLPGGLCTIYDCKIKHITDVQSYLDRPNSSLLCRPGCTSVFIPTPMGLLVTCKCKGKTGDSDGPTPLDNGCPDDYLCQQSCRNRGYKAGKCSGLNCICR